MIALFDRARRHLGPRHGGHGRAQRRQLGQLHGAEVHRRDRQVRHQDCHLRIERVLEAHPCPPSAVRPGRSGRAVSLLRPFRPREERGVPSAEAADGPGSEAPGPRTRVRRRCRSRYHRPGRRGRASGRQERRQACERPSSASRCGRRSDATEGCSATCRPPVLAATVIGELIAQDGRRRRRHRRRPVRPVLPERRGAGDRPGRRPRRRPSRRGHRATSSTAAAARVCRPSSTPPCRCRREPATWCWPAAPRA